MQTQYTLKLKKPSNTLSEKFLTLPAIIMVAIVTQGLFLATILLSFIRWIVVRPDLGRGFAGFSNYLWLFNAPETYQVIGNTIAMTGISLALCLVFGMLFALLLNRYFPLRKLCRTLILIPFFMMDVVVGIIWKTLLLHPSFGISGSLAQFLGTAPPDFIGEYAFLTVIMMIVWRWTPFFVLILLSGLQGINPEIMESAKIDGAGHLRTLFQIKIPAIRYHVEVAAMLGLIFILKVFGLIHVTTAGGPGFVTTNLPLHVYKISRLKWDVGQAASYATITVIMTLLVIMFLFKFIRKRIQKAET